MKKTNLLTTLLVSGAVMLAPMSALCKSSQELLALKKIEQLQQLTQKAKEMGFDTQREECAIWMAEAFLGYATWDEQNTELNSYQYSTFPSFKKDAVKLAQELPEFEREEVVKLLDSAIEQAQAVISGEITRPVPVDIDWHNSTIEGDSYKTNGKTFFFNYNGAPQEYGVSYQGLTSGGSLSMGMKSSEKGISKSLLKELKNKEESYSGGVHIPHPTPSKWMVQKDSSITDGTRPFTRYDIDNPLVRETWSEVIKKVVPLYEGKSWTRYGYSLSNEPHWILMKNQWAAGILSKYSKAKFRDWLKAKHKNIARLNELWQTNFDSFESVDVEVPFDGELYGTPLAYDLMRFNQDRAMDWFTFLADGIRKHDSQAKISVKIMPDLFGGDRRDNGLDFERITELSDIIGNDAKIVGRSVYAKHPEHWEESYIFNWHDVGIPYDFMHSVSPEKANLNSETHFLSTVHFRDKYLSKEYTRATYWLATMQGMDGSHTWFWARDKNGEIRKSLRAGVEHADNAMAQAYVASIAQQPRVTNEITQTYYDMNSLSEELTAIQRLRRPIRIYYSEHSALNMLDYMSTMEKLYNPLFFSGNPVGFATESIIKKQDCSAWDAIIVRNTPFVLESEIDALQSYLDKGGVVVIDNLSFKMNEYGEPHSKQLKQSKGKIIRRSSIDQFVKESLKITREAGSMPLLNVTERNSNPVKGCLWRVTKMDDGRTVVSIVNIGKTEATLNIMNPNGTYAKNMNNMLTGKTVYNGFKMRPYDVLMLEVKN